MGNGGKDTDKDEQKTRKKPGRVPTSCAECRRLKLRCDRKVPCEKCVQRGCGSICPDGALTPGRGNRMILANTEELHAQIESQSSKIRQLESELRSMQAMMTMRPDAGITLPSSSSSPAPAAQATLEPLRSTDSDAMQDAEHASRSSSREKEGEGEDEGGGGVKVEDDTVIDAFGTLTIGQRGESRFLGKTARSEYLIFAPPRTSPTTPLSLPRLSHRLTQTSFPESEIADTTGLARDALHMLPPLSEAVRLCEVYLEYGKYLYTPVRRNEVFDEILTVVYRADVENFKAHHPLALLFSIFSLATLFDSTKPPMAVEAREWFYLARTALQLASPVRETTLASVQTMIHMAQYLDFVDSGVSGDNEAWMYIGHAVRLGYSIGLHLNAARWKLNEEAVERRNRVFWPLFVLDTWSSFFFGRPPGMSLAYTDCPLPKDIEETILPDGSVLPSFAAWNYKFTALLHTIMSTAFGPKQPNYATILQLDRKIRDFPVPIPWRPLCNDGVPSGKLETWLILFARETTLLNLHRACFAQALAESPHDLSNHRYIPSVVAIYRSAWRISRTLEIIWDLFQFLICRMNIWWSQALSAAIVMCLIATKAPLSLLAQPALEELNFMIKTFEKAAPVCVIAARLLPSLKRISRKAQEMLGHASPHQYALDDSPVTPAELDRLGGKTHLLSSTLSRDDDFHSPGSGSVPVTLASTPANSNPSSMMMSENFFDSTFSAPQMQMHPTIVQDMRNFAVRNESGPVSNHIVNTGTLYDYPSSTPTFTTIPGGYGTFEQLMLEVQEQERAVSNRTFERSSAAASAVFAPGRELYLDYPPQQSAGFGAGSLVLDSTWQSFVEQLGF